MDPFAACLLAVCISCNSLHCLTLGCAAIGILHGLLITQMRRSCQSGRSPTEGSHCQHPVAHGSP
jgi:hypothetical protein